jgi:hypothetical protein
MPDQKHTAFENRETQPVSTARVIFDTSLEVFHSGVRGIDPDRHLLFVGPDLDIHVKISQVDRHKEIYGQVITHGPREDSATILLLSCEAPQEMTAGPFGEFNFDEVPSGDVSLEILLPSGRVVAAFDTNCREAGLCLDGSRS